MHRDDKIDLLFNSVYYIKIKSEYKKNVMPMEG